MCSKGVNPVKRDFSLANTKGGGDSMIQIFTSEKDSLVASQELLNIFLSEELFDVTLSLDCGAQIRAHRLVLAQHSKMFRRMLSSDFQEGKKQVINLGEVAERDVRGMLRFFYQGKTGADDVDEAIALARAAELYQAVVLRDACVEALERNISPENAVDVLRGSRSAGLSRLEAECTRLLRESFRELAQSPHLALLDAETLANVIQGDSLNARDEDEVYGAVMRWLRETMQEDEGSAQVLMLIRFPQLSPGLLTSEVQLLGSESPQGQTLPHAALAKSCLEGALSALRSGARPSSNETSGDDVHHGGQHSGTEYGAVRTLPAYAFQERRFGGETAWAYSSTLQPWILEGHEGSITCLIGWRDCVLSSSQQYSPSERTLQVWSSKNWKSQQDLACNCGDVLSLHILGDVLFCGTSEGGVIAWDLTSWVVIDRLTEHVGEVQALTSLDARYLITGSSDAMLLLWDTKQIRCQAGGEGGGCKIVQQLESTDSFQSINCVAACSERGIIVSASSDNCVRIWRKPESKAWECDQTVALSCEIKAITMVDSVDCFAVALDDGEVRFFHATSGLLVSALSAHPGSPVRAMTINGNNQLVSVADDGLIRGWDVDKLDDSNALAWTLKVEEDDGVEDTQVRDKPNSDAYLVLVIVPSPSSCVHSVSVLRFRAHCPGL